MSLRRTIAAVSLSAFALGGLAACGGEDDDTRQTAEPTTSVQQQSTIPTAEELTVLLDQASDPAGAEAPEIFDQIAALKADQGANVAITGVAEGDIPGTLIASAVITQPGEADIPVEAQFINQGGNWMLQKSFACALITNAGLEAPPTCAMA